MTEICNPLLQSPTRDRWLSLKPVVSYPESSTRDDKVQGFGDILPCLFRHTFVELQPKNGVIGTQARILIELSLVASHVTYGDISHCGSMLAPKFLIPKDLD